jgi:hypothetical protein
MVMLDAQRLHQDRQHAILVREEYVCQKSITYIYNATDLKSRHEKRENDIRTMESQILGAYSRSKRIDQQIRN